MNVDPTLWRALASAGAIFLTAHIAYGQTAACCLGDQCEELEQAACEDQDGEWLGDRPSPPGPSTSSSIKTELQGVVLTVGATADER